MTQKTILTPFSRWYNGTFLLMLVGVVLYLLALPPVGAWPLGWLVAACWVPLIRRKRNVSYGDDFAGAKEKTSNNSKKRTKYWLKNRPYRQIGLAGLIFWLIAAHWVCFPYWATCFGWVALSCYLGLYFPLFVFFSRIVYHSQIFGRFHVPVCLATPIAWVATAYLQKHLLGGFAFASLEHTQMYQTHLIQIADVMGEYGVAAAMIFVGTLIGGMLPVRISDSAQKKVTPELPDTANANLQRPLVCFALRCVAVVLTFLVLIAYGHPKLMPEKIDKKMRIALLQGNDRAILNAPPGWYDTVFEHFLTLAKETCDKDQGIDLVIWPESTAIYYWVDYDFSDMSPEQMARISQQKVDEYLSDYRKEITALARQLCVPQILGVPSTVRRIPQETDASYNSALLIDQQGTPHARYDKMLLVMFGEYVPFADMLPDGFFLKTLCQRADHGKQPVCFSLHSQNDPNAAPIKASPNICFESISPHMIRDQVLTLKKQGNEPDVLINISNDGWFRHSSQIDMHLATHIFRAIENRKPYLTATNGGFSAYINSTGKVVACGERQKRMAVVADVVTTNRTSPYHAIGDIPAFLMLCLSLLMTVTAVLFRKNRT